MSYEDTELGALTAVQALGGNGSMLGGGLTSVVVAGGMGALAAIMTGPKTSRKKIAIWGAVAGLVMYYGSGVLLGDSGVFAAARPFTPLVAGWGVSKLEERGKLPAVGPAS